MTIEATPHIRAGVALLAGVLLALGPARAEPDLPPVAQARDGDFSSLVLITSDVDWQMKWNDQAADAPRFRPARELKVGDTATVLALFSGITEGNGRLQAICAIEIRKPDGSTSATPEAPCYDEMSLGQRTNVLMANARVEFKVAANDPAGWWRFRIMIRDANSHARTESEIGVLVAKEAMRP